MPLLSHTLVSNHRLKAKINWTILVAGADFGENTTDLAAGCRLRSSKCRVRASHVLQEELEQIHHCNREVQVREESPASFDCGTTTKRTSRPHVLVSLLETSVQSNTPITGSSGCRRKRTRIKLNQAHWNVFWKRRRKICPPGVPKRHKLVELTHPRSAETACNSEQRNCCCHMPTGAF